MGGLPQLRKYGRDELTPRRTLDTKYPRVRMIVEKGDQSDIRFSTALASQRLRASRNPFRASLP